MNKAKIDIPVLLIFFNRPDHIRQVFEQVKLARPSKLYLYQDGARLNRLDDVKNVEKCRAVLCDEQIDWECEVYRLYQTENYGCDPSEFIAQKWMFESEEYGIVLEDDDIPSQSFFPFCKELLERYKDDDRINIICGMNNTGVSEHLKESYLFTQKGSIWGWASWRRVIDTWDGKYEWMDNQTKREIIKKNMGDKHFNEWIKIVERHKKSGREHYESILAASLFLYNRLNIVPKYNMITNIGLSQESTHSVSDIRLLPKSTQRLMHMERYEIEFPLLHPKNIVANKVFERKMTLTLLEKFFAKIESLGRSVRYLGVGGTLIRIKKRIERKRSIEYKKR